MNQIKIRRKRAIRIGGAGFIVLATTVFVFFMYDHHAQAYTLSSASSISDTNKEDAGYYLNVSGNVHTNFINQHVISGYITNISRQNNYKDVQLNVKFFDENEKELGSKLYVIPISIPSGETQSYKLRTNAPAGTKTLKWNVVNAAIF
jgi:hypothetical protein